MKLKRFALVLLALILCVSALTISASAATKPKAPVVKASNVASSGEIKLTWNAVSGAKNYKIYRASEENGTYEEIKTTTSTSFTNTAPEPGDTYWYYVKAVSANGTASKASANVSATCKLPRPTVILSNISSSGKIKVSWKSVDGATKYYVYRATSKDGSYTKLGETSKLSFSNTGAAAGKTYYYKVKAIHSKSAASSAYSSIKEKTCDLPRPEVTASNLSSSGKIKLSWKAIDGAVEYHIYRSTTGKDGSYSKLGETTKTSYTNSSATAGKQYYYKVKAIYKNSAANSAYSSAVKRTCDLARPVVAVSNLSSSGDIKLSWKSVSGAKSYQVYRSKSKDSGFSLLSTVTGTSLINRSASVNTTYYYKVKAIASNSDANSAYSSVKSGKIPGTYTAKYVATPTFTIYQNADGSGDSATLKYMTKVYLKTDLTGSEGTLYRARYNNKSYYAWNAKGATNFTTKYSKLDYSDYTRNQRQDDLVEKAVFYLDVPTKYVQSAEGEKVSGKYQFDCSGFASHVINEVFRKENPSFDLTSNLQQLYGLGTSVSKKDKSTWRPGDVIFFKLNKSSSKTVDHCAIYLGKNEFIHATTTVNGVTRAPLDNSFSSKVVGIRRYSPN